MLPELNEKETQVLSLLAADPGISVTDLAARIAVSTVTMRSYLNGLSEKGYIYRVRGGAVPRIHPDILERERSRQDEKHRISAAAAEMVDDGQTIMIEAGTTTAMIARYLLGKRDVSVVTNNTLALAHCRGNPGLRVQVVGGEYRAATESIVGPPAMEHIRRFHVKTAFIGTDGFSPEQGLTTHLVEGAEIVKCMARNADVVVMVADSSKYNRSGFVEVLPLANVHVIVSDSGLPENAVRAIEEKGPRVIRV